jgi:DNA-binding response OmpR family regulator
VEKLYRILVVDDEPAIRTLLNDVFTAAGFEVVEAANGRLGIQAHLANPADLVITDLLMPQQEGIETITELSRRAPGLPIIAISGAYTGPELKMAARLGASAVFAKPFDPEQLVAAAHGLLGL